MICLDARLSDVWCGLVVVVAGFDVNEPLHWLGGGGQTRVNCVNL